MRKHLILMTVAATLLTSCGGSKTTTAEADKFDYTVEQFADLQILRYKVPGFEELTLKQKELIYYLTEAALEGRDILFDQNGKYNLRIRRMLEAVYTNYQGDKTTPDFKNMEVYLKRVWSTPFPAGSQRVNDSVPPACAVYNGRNEHFRDNYYQKYH